MAAGAILGGRCYPSQTDALDAYYSGLAPQSQAGATSYYSEFVQLAGVWTLRQYQVDGAGAWTLRSSTPAPIIAFPVCDPSEAFFDGMAVGWGIVAAMVAATAVAFLKRGARGG